MLRVLTTGCSALARVASRLASRMLLFDTLLVALFLAAAREPVVNTSSVLSAGVSSTSDAFLLTPVGVAGGGSLSLLSQRRVNHSFNSSCRPCDVTDRWHASNSDDLPDGGRHAASVDSSGD